MLTAAVRAVGATAYRVGVVPDDARQLMETLEDQLVRADLVITTGGVCMGAYDTVKEVLSRVGTVQFDKVAMRPGMPQGFGVVGAEQVPVFTLPGQPGQLARLLPRLRAPALRAMAGPPREGVPARLRPGGRGRVVGSVEGKMEFTRVVDGRRPRAARGWAGLARAGRPGRGDALAVVPAGGRPGVEGDEVCCLPLLGDGGAMSRTRR